MGHLDWGGIFEEGPRSMVSHHVPVGSLPRAGGWDRGRGCGAAADGVLGQYLFFFFNLVGAFILCSIARTAQYVHWEILHKRLERPPNDWPASCSYGLICSGGFPSHPRGFPSWCRGWDRDRSAAADGVLGQYLFFNFVGVFVSVVFQELHNMCIGRLSVSVCSDHLMIGLHPAHMGLSAVVVSHPRAGGYFSHSIQANNRGHTFCNIG